MITHIHIRHDFPVLDWFRPANEEGDVPSCLALDGLAHHGEGRR